MGGERGKTPNEGTPSLPENQYTQALERYKTLKEQNGDRVAIDMGYKRDRKTSNTTPQVITETVPTTPSKA